MSPETLLALMGFAFVTSVTPGPSNLLLLASSANFGLRRSVHLVFGISFSFLTMLLAVGFGLGQVLRAYPAAGLVLKGLSLAYILWLAWKIAGSVPAAGKKSADEKAAGAPEDKAVAAARPLSFLQMASLQWVNPKAWAVALAVTVAYTTPADYPMSLIWMVLVFGLVNLPSVGAWAVGGSALRGLLADPGRLRLFNRVMAVLLVVSMLPVVFDVVPG